MTSDLLEINEFLIREEEEKKKRQEEETDELSGCFDEDSLRDGNEDFAESDVQIPIVLAAEEADQAQVRLYVDVSA